MIYSDQLLGMVRCQTTTRTIVREHEAELLVQKAEVVAEDVVALTLVSPAGETLPSWSPGAHIDLVLADDLVRQYSLCSSPGGGRRLAHRSPAHPGQPRGVAAGARHPDRGRHRDHPGAAQSLPAGGRIDATCSSPAASASPRCCR